MESARILWGYSGANATMDTKWMVLEEIAPTLTNVKALCLACMESVAILRVVSSVCALLTMNWSLKEMLASVSLKSNIDSEVTLVVFRS